MVEQHLRLHTDAAETCKRNSSVHNNPVSGENNCIRIQFIKIDKLVVIIVETARLHEAEKWVGVRIERWVSLFLSNCLALCASDEAVYGIVQLKRGSVQSEVWVGRRWR